MKISKIGQDYIDKYINLLDNKKAQTSYKIDYVTKYVQNWLCVLTNVADIQNINFIDCMCNAGVYTDGDKGTAIRVLELFNEFAPKHLDKKFNLILNDINQDRIEAIKDIINKCVGIKYANINVIFNKQDVNVFLLQDDFFHQYFYCNSKKSANLIFVDPYNFCTVKISSLSKFLLNHYCELLFNIFTSDFVRNQDTEKMKKFCLEEKIKINSKQDMIATIRTRLKVGSIRYSFSYEFKSSKNAEIYQIIFFTPNVKGLEKLKEALWSTFNGKEFHRNENKASEQQLNLFSEGDDKDWMITVHSAIAKKLLLEEFNNKEIDYQELEIFIIENTILGDNHIIRNVLKPLIEEKKIKKLGLVNNSRDYKKDKYRIG